MSENSLGVAHGEIIITANTAGLAPAVAAVQGVGKAAEASAMTSAAAFKKMSTGMLVFGGIIAGGLALAVKSAEDFEKSVSDIGSVTGDTGAALDVIREKALQLGKDTVFSAGESADAMFELAKAGIVTKDIIEGAADATVSLAAAGQIDMPTAASVMSAAMNTYGVAAKDAAHVADLMAGAANKSATDVVGVGEAFKYAAPLANAAGVSIEDLTTGIAALAKGGITGSMAGTTLRQMLIALTPQSDAAAREMTKLGIITKDGSNQFYDAAGNLKDMNEISGILQGAISGLSEEQKTQALSTIFGSRALAGAVSLAAQGKDGFTELGQAIAGVDAEEVAAARMDNLAGSIEMLKGSLETFTIQLGSVLTPIIRNLADQLTVVTNWFINLSDGAKTFLVVGALVTASVLLIGGALIKLIQFGMRSVETLKALHAATLASDSALRTNLVTLKAHVVTMLASARAYVATSIAAVQAAFAQGGFAAALKATAAAMRGVVLAAGVIGLAIAGISAIVADYARQQDEAAARTDTLTAAIQRQATEGMRVTAEAIANMFLAWSSGHGTFMQQIEATGLTIDEFMAAVLEGGPALEALNSKLYALEQVGGATTGMARGLQKALKEVQTAFGEATVNAAANETAMTAVENAYGPAADEAAALAAENETLAGALDTATEAFSGLRAALDASAAMDKVRENLHSITKLVKEQGTSLDETTVKGRLNRDSLRGMFGDVATAAEAWGKRYGKSQDEIDAKASTLMKELRRKLIDEGFKPADLNTFMRGLDALPGQLAGVTESAAETMHLGMTAVGKDGAMGLALGFAQNNGPIIGAVRKMTQLAISEARAQFDTGSPSKVFIKIGGDVVDGLVLGLANLKGVSQKIQDALGPAIDKANERIARWVARQKAQLDKAVSAWNDYHSAVLSSITGNVNMGTAWTDTQDQMKAVKDAQEELTAAQKDYNAAVADANADAADSGKPAKAVDNSALVAAQSTLAAAEAAARSFEQNFSAQINDSYLFGSAFQSASAAISDQFGLDSPIWQMLSAQMLAMGPGAGTEMAQYIAENGLTPEMEAQLVNWNAWSGIVAEQQASYNKQHGIDMAEDAMLGIEDKIKEEQERLQKIGKKIGAGLIIGFKEKKSDFKDAVDAYIRAAENALGIHSPSKEFMTIGEQVAAGFEQGLRSGLPAVERVMRGMSEYGNLSVAPYDAGRSVVNRSFIPPVAASASGPIMLQAKVFVGNREITDIVRTEIKTVDEATMAYIMGGA